MDSIDRAFINALFKSNYYKGCKALDIYIVKIIFKIFNKINFTYYMEEDFRTVNEIIDFFTLHSQSRLLLEWMLNFLQYMGYVQSKISKYKIIRNISDSDTLDDTKKILQFIPTADIFIKLIEFIEMGIDDFFAGHKSGKDILFCDEKMINLWNKFFNNYFYCYSLINSCLAYGITKWFSQTNGKSMLEIGSGTSGATIKVFQMLNDNSLLDSIDRILLTDVVVSLLDMGDKNIKQQMSTPPYYDRKILDINKPFKEQGFTKESFDIIYGGNVLHVAQDLDFSLGELYRHLNDKGILVIAETTRPVDKRVMYQELIFNLLDNYYDVQLNPETRPYHGFLTKEKWLKTFQRAGFNNFEFITELDNHDELDFNIKPLHSLLVLKGQK